jgi:uncharacterized protein
MKPSASMLQQEVPSPCVGICALDDAGICAGCGRTIAEISEWPAASSRRRLEVRALAATRHAMKRQGAQQ